MKSHMKPYIPFLTLGALALSAVAATMPAPGSISTSGKSTLIGTDNGTVAITPITPDIFKVSRIPAGTRSFSFPALRPPCFLRIMTA